MHEALGSIPWTQRELHKGRMHLQKSGRWWPPGSLSPLLIRMGHLKGKSILAELWSSCSQAERPSAPSAPSAPLRMTVSRGLSLSCQVAELRRAFNQQALWPAAPVASPLKELWQASPASRRRSEEQLCKWSLHYHPCACQAHCMPGSCTQPHPVHGKGLAWCCSLALSLWASDLNLVVPQFPCL